MKIVALDVGQCKVTDEYLVTAPRRLSAFGCIAVINVWRQAESEQRQFESESLASRTIEIAGYVPPLVAEFGMRPVVCREFSS